MSGMNEYLAAHYGTAGTTSSPQASEEVEKRAQIELFAKLAADQKIDLNALTDAQVTELWNNFQKQAAEEPKEEPKDMGKEEKLEAAKKEHEEKKEAAEKLAEADFLGRVMAHSYVDELKKIAAANEAAASEGKEVQAAAAAELAAIKQAAGNFGKGEKSEKGGFPAFMKGKGGKEDKKPCEEPKKGKKKEGSAIDELAAELALSKAAEAGLPAEEVAKKIAAVLTLGPSMENSKVAFAKEFPEALEVRSLELLEMAGYPVQWAQ